MAEIARTIVSFILVLGLLFGLASYVHISMNAPDPYNVCEDPKPPMTQQQCRSMVSFALSAGW